MAVKYLPVACRGQRVYAATLDAAQTFDRLQAVEAPYPIHQMAASGATLAALGTEKICLAQATELREWTCTKLGDIFGIDGDWRIEGHSDGRFLLVGTHAGQKIFSAVAVVEGQAKVVKEATSCSVVTPLIRTSGLSAFGCVLANSEASVIDVYGLEDGMVLSSENLHETQEKDQGMVPLSRAFLGSYRRKDGTQKYRLLALQQDDAMWFYQQNTIVWQSQQALAAVESTMFLDLPPPEHPLAANTAPTATLLDRMMFQIISLKMTFNLHSSEELVTLESLRELISLKGSLLRDPNGFRCMILAATQSGVVSAIHSGTGDILWSTWLSQMRSDSPKQIFIWKYSHRVDEDPLVAVLGESKTSQSLLVIIDPYTGKVKQQNSLPYQVDMVLRTPKQVLLQSGHQDVHLLLAKGQAAGTAYIHPSQLEGTSAHQAIGGEDVLWTIDYEAGVLRGLKPLLAAGMDVQKGIQLDEVWRIQVPADQVVLACASRDARRSVKQYIKILDNGGIGYRYLNPNMLVLVTGLRQEDAKLFDDDDFKITLHFVDTITGRIIFRQVHLACTGPVQAILIEDTVYYQYWSIKHKRLVLGVIELYEQVPREISILDVVTSAASNETKSSYDPLPIRAVQESYFPRQSLKLLDSSVTKLGITTRQLLMGTMYDQVYLLDVRLLDRRRMQQLAKSKADRSQVSRVLQIVPTSFATVDKQVLGLRNVAVTTANLESTSLMLAYGLDLYFTRILPAKAYDSLAEGFPYALLVATTIIMALVSVVLHYVSARIKLQRKWK